MRIIGCGVTMGLDGGFGRPNYGEVDTAGKDLI